VALAQDGDVAFALSGALSGLGVAAAGLPYLVIYRTGPP
jgi:lipid A disaccharide synthetase